MNDYSIHEIKDSGSIRYEIRRTLTQDELKAICIYASSRRMSVEEAIQIYLNEVQELVDLELRNRLENHILFGKDI